MSINLNDIPRAIRAALLRKANLASVSDPFIVQSELDAATGALSDPGMAAAISAAGANSPSASRKLMLGSQNLQEGLDAAASPTTVNPIATLSNTRLIVGMFTSNPTIGAIHEHSLLQFDTTSQAISAVLPNDLGLNASGYWIILHHLAGSNTLTIDHNGMIINGASEDVVLHLGEWALLSYESLTGNWGYGYFL